jgi:hypothetical protein
VVWLMNSMEELIKGEDIRDFCRTFRVGNMAYVMQRPENIHRRFLEVSEYGGGRQ